jgi:putative membrane protein
MNMKRNVVLPVLMACVLLIGTSCSDDDNDSSDLSAYDRDFLTMAAQANLAEIRAGEVASMRASHQEVKDFGEHMVTDHTKAWADLKTVAERNNHDLPDEPDEAHQRKLEELSEMSGHMFDTAYVNSQVKDHQMAISLFSGASSSANNKEVRDYATIYLPHLEDHLKQAEALKAMLESINSLGRIGQK